MKALIKYGWDLYKKYEEGINYLIFGFLAFVLNYALYFLFESVLQLNYLVATGLSWVLTVIFAYWTNRTFVFKSKKPMRKEAPKFVLSRVSTWILDIVVMQVLTALNINLVVASVISAVLVTIANYVFSKLFVFNKSKDA